MVYGSVTNYLWNSQNKLCIQCNVDELAWPHHLRQVCFSTGGHQVYIPISLLPTKLYWLLYSDWFTSYLIRALIPYHSHLLLLLSHVVLRALWKIDVHLISTLVNKSLYYYYYYYHTSNFSSLWGYFLHCSNIGYSFLRASSARITNDSPQ